MSLLNGSVLILNKFFMAIQVTNARAAISALVGGKVKCVDLDYSTYDLQNWKIFSEEYQGTEEAKRFPGVIRSPSTTLLVPEVVIDPDCEFNSPHIKTVRYSRKSIYQRDKNTCQYCGKKCNKKEITLDHIVPRSKQGKSTWTNVVACCTNCNSNKRDKSLEELGWKLLKTPKKPHWKSHIGTPFNMEKRNFWEMFLD